MATTLTQSGDYTFFPTRAYFERLAKEIDAAPAKSRILLAAMAFDPHFPAIAKVLDALQHAASKGSAVSLYIDSYVYLVDEDKHFGPLFYHSSLPHRVTGIFKTIQDTVRKLRDAGVDVVITNPPKRRFTSPFAGRSHIKASIINDVVYIGGCNLSAMHTDIMVPRQHKTTADWLYDLLSRRSKAPTSLEAFGRQDITHAIDKQTELLVDVGVKKQSAIYKQALAVIDSAQEWLVVSCQYFPNSLTAKHLRAASQRGVHVVPIFNHYSVHSQAHKLLQHAVTSRERLRMPTSFFTGELKPGANYLHAKILANEHEAMIGSHNYVTAGVNFGTAEIALHVTDASFAKAAARCILAETDLLETVNLPL